MSALVDRIPANLKVTDHRPWWRALVGEVLWRDIAAGLADGRLTLVSLWGEPRTVHMAVLDEGNADIGIVSLHCPEGRFPSVGRIHPPAIRLERTVRDLFGLEPDGLPDTRAWLDHGRWPARHPLAGGGPPSQVAPYAFLPAEGEGLHQIPVGPIHAGIIEPGHFRFHAQGEIIVRLEERLGWVHRGLEGMMEGADLDRAARLAARASGDSTVAYSLAFARAVEAAAGVEAPRRAVWLRAVMAELERIANHLGDVGAICNDAAFALLQAHFSVLREMVARAAFACFGHRMMMDRVVPGGLAVDLDGAGEERLRALVGELRPRLAELVDIYDGTASLKERTVSTGFLSAELARRYGAGGYVGRASGRGVDARVLPGYAPYDDLLFEVPTLTKGDVNARVWVRIREIGESLGLIEKLLLRLPGGPVHAPVEAPARGEGAAMVESFRGDVFVWVRLGAEGRVVRAHLRDPSWFQWPLLEAAVEGNIVADFPLCNKSFNCSYSGHDG
jgi:Ni,Fe-hydrogenase III large subunit